MSKLEVTDIPRYKYSDYEQWKGDWELIDGYPIAMSPSPMVTHQSVCMDTLMQLGEVLEECERCEVFYEIDWMIDEENVVRPDIIVVCDNEDEKYITKAPKIIFEVISKSTAHNDRVIKYKIYESEGVKYYIIIDPENRVAKVYKLQEGRFIKQIDATSEKYRFMLDECEFEFDFSRVWRRLKRR